MQIAKLAHDAIAQYLYYPSSRCELCLESGRFFPVSNPIFTFLVADCLWSYLLIAIFKKFFALFIKHQSDTFLLLSGCPGMYLCILFKVHIVYNDVYVE